MTDPQVVEDVANEDHDADFEAGFNLARGDESEPVTEPAVEAAEPEVKEATAPAEEEPVVLNQSEVKALLTRLDEIDRLKRSQDQAFGRLGSLQDVVNKLQSSGAAGGSIELTDEDVAELSDFPELQGTMRSVLQKTLSKVRPGVAQSTFDPAPLQVEIQKLREEREADARKYEAKLLSTHHRDWREVTAGDSFRVWLAAQPDEYRNRINNSWDAEEIGEALSAYKSQAAKTVVTKQKKTDRLAAAVTPTGVRSPDTSAMNENDAFEQGFRSVRR